MHSTGKAWGYLKGHCCSVVQCCAQPSRSTTNISFTYAYVSETWTNKHTNVLREENTYIFLSKAAVSSFEQKSILLLKSQQKYVLLHKLLDILGSLMSGSTRHFFTGTKNMIFVLVFVEKIPIIIANSAPVSVMAHSSSSLLALLSKT